MLEDPRFSFVVLVREDTAEEPEEPRVIDPQHNPISHTYSNLG